MATAPGRRALRLVLLAAAAALLSGCVYLRLLQLKRQLARFDDNFAVQSSDDLVLNCLHPVLTGADLRWIGAEPHAIYPRNDGEEWLVRWIKTPASGTMETAVFDMEFSARLTGDRLTGIVIPQRYFAYFPKELFLNLLRSTGGAKVSRNDKQAEAQTETPPDTPLPNLKTVESLLGAPTVRHAQKDQVVYLYTYRLDVPKPATAPVEVTFTFDPGTGNLRRLTARLAHGTLKYDFSAAVSEKR